MLCLISYKTKQCINGAYGYPSSVCYVCSTNYPLGTVCSCQAVSSPSNLPRQGKYNYIVIICMLTSMLSNCLWVVMPTPFKVNVKLMFMIHIYLDFILSSRLFNGQQGIIIQNFSTRSILTVTNVTQEHFGNYTCVAANKLGTTNASLPLNRK